MNFFDRNQSALWTALFFACLSMIEGAGVTCYQCTVAPKPGAKPSSNQICRHFDQSQHFQTYCPNSTLCMKRSIHHRLRNGTLVLTSVERGCASQLDIRQAYDFDKRMWHEEQEIVASAYEERCFVGPDRGSPGGPPEYCFCSYNLCNKSSRTTNILETNILLGFILFLIQRSIC